MTRQSGDWTPQQLAKKSRDPARLQGPRWAVSLRALVVVLAMMAAAVGVLWLEAAGVEGASAQLSSETSDTVLVPPVGGSSATPLPASAAALPRPSVASVVVHVVGAVKNPGVYTVTQGSRVFQAIAAAGGALPSAGLSAVNLAATVSDGSQIYLPTQDEAAALPAPGARADPSSGEGGGAGSGGAAIAPGLINLNTATAAELETLPGVGPVLAQRIVAWRTDHGAFSSVDGLSAVTGIGPKLLAGLRESVTVS
ncbi:competence protein ComEA [Arthrobacter psychrolactophilus]|uniref:Competence protein ComEA n=1 Tax=Arthrobacter psychrolactophilus TaxID=92442 RepID=A0A2V5JKE8_9MICC|nr:helix-hairpin-helix domain-containing protein [Arthrobacter psychrolactophilus]PYI37956.1 competence protein ComEA [Arthrobacter psychrolactophilus]